MLDETWLTFWLILSALLKMEMYHFVHSVTFCYLFLSLLCRKKNQISDL